MAKALVTNANHTISMVTKTDREERQASTWSFRHAHMPLNGNGDAVSTEEACMDGHGHRRGDKRLSERKRIMHLWLLERAFSM